MPVNETLALRARARHDASACALSLAVVNRVSPKRFSAAEARALDAPRRRPRRRRGAAAATRARARSTRQLARLRRGLGCPVVGLHDLLQPALDARVDPRARRAIWSACCEPAAQERAKPRHAGLGERLDGQARRDLRRLGRRRQDDDVGRDRDGPRGAAARASRS